MGTLSKPYKENWIAALFFVGHAICEESKKKKGREKSSGFSKNTPYTEDMGCFYGKRNVFQLFASLMTGQKIRK
jgi:hypothetical protein